MIKTMPLKRRHKVLAIIAAFLLMGNIHTQAAWVGSEGDEWLKWDANARQTYVLAYVRGMQSGFTRGCDLGISTVEPKMGAGDIVRYTSECVSRSPISDRDSMKMIDSITTFYKRYPMQRFLYISDILLGLHAGRTVDQIHEHFAGTNQ